MSTLNLSPKNPAMALLLAGAAVWLLTRRTAASAPAAGVAPQTISGPGGAFSGGLQQAFNAIASIFRTGEPAAQTAAREAGRLAVRAGDPYYGGDDAVTGSSAEFWAQQAFDDALAWQGGTFGTTGDPYNY